jgi:hypothetical protein
MNLGCKSINETRRAESLAEVQLKESSKDQLSEKLNQGTLTEWEGSIQLTSFCKLVSIRYRKH